MEGDRHFAQSARLSEAVPERAGVHGVLDMSIVADSKTRIDRLFQKQPLRSLQPRTDDIYTAVIANTAGGVVGGDRHSVSVVGEPDSTALITGQAAEKIYRSAGPTARIENQICARDGAWLEWLPQGTILFDGSRLHRTTQLSVEGRGRLLAGEVLTFGRTAMGETWTRGFLHDDWQARQDGRLIWADRLRLDDRNMTALQSPAGLDGAHAMGTVIYLAADAPSRLDLARRCLAATSATMRSGATVLPGIVIVRWLGRDATALRTSFGAFWKAFRHAAGGHHPELPVLWNI